MTILICFNVCFFFFHLLYSHFLNVKYSRFFYRYRDSPINFIVQSAAVVVRDGQKSHSYCCCFCLLFIYFHIYCLKIRLLKNIGQQLLEIAHTVYLLLTYHSRISVLFCITFSKEKTKSSQNTKKGFFKNKTKDKLLNNQMHGISLTWFCGE